MYACSGISTPTRLKKLIQKLNKGNTTDLNKGNTTGLCKKQFVQMIILCVKKKNKENEVDGKLKVKLTTIDAMWVLIQPMQVNDREEISAELLGAWLFSKVEGKMMVGGGGELVHQVHVTVPLAPPNHPRHQNAVRNQKT